MPGMFYWPSDILFLGLCVETYIFILEKRKEKWMPTGTHWQLDWELTIYLGQHFGETLKRLPFHLTLLTICSLQQFIYPMQQKATAPGPLCFDQVEANHWSVEQEAVGMAWYGPQWQAARLWALLQPWQSCYFMTKWLSLKWLQLFTYKANPNIPCTVFLVWKRYICAWLKFWTKPHVCLSCVLLFWQCTLARKGKGNWRRVDLN